MKKILSLLLALCLLCACSFALAEADTAPAEAEAAPAEAETVPAETEAVPAETETDAAEADTTPTKADAALPVLIDFGEFSLELAHGEKITPYGKGANQVLAIVYPYYAASDLVTTYNFTWLGETFSFTAEEIAAELSLLEENLRTQFTQGGYEITALTLDNPYDATLNGVDCVVLEFTVSLSAGDVNVTLYQREVMVGSIGCIITLSAADPDTLEDITTMMAQSLNL